MISQTLTFVREQLNTELQHLYPTPEDLVVVSALSQPDGCVPAATHDHLVLTVINIEPERGVAYTANRTPHNEGSLKESSAPVPYNLYLLISASFDNYSDGLKYLSAVLDYFQHCNSFTTKNAPMLPTQIEKLTLELTTLDLQEINNIWKIHGGKYLPSLVYKARPVTISDTVLQHQVPEITSIKSKL